MTVLSPFVYWAQNEKCLFLKVDLQDVKDPLINFGKRKLGFKSLGQGAKGLHEYEFSIDFSDEIEVKGSSYKLTDNRVDITLAKSESGWWPRLTSQPQKPGWLKIDFDKWQSEEDLNDEKVQDIRKDFPDLYEKLKRDEYGYKKEDLRQAYLTLYNLLMFVGYLYVLLVLLIRFSRDGYSSSYLAAAPALRLLQLIQFLEVLHVLLGVVRGNPIMSLMQTMGRAVVLFGVLGAKEFGEEPADDGKQVLWLFIAWATAEIIRYPFYLTQIYKHPLPVIEWLRYNAWIILYPLGFSCEAVTIYRGLAYLDEIQHWSIGMPNMLNVTFHFPTFLRIYLLFFIFPGSVLLMSHMWRMRIKNKEKVKKH